MNSQKFDGVESQTFFKTLFAICALTAMTVTAYGTTQVGSSNSTLTTNEFLIRFGRSHQRIFHATSQVSKQASGNKFSSAAITKEIILTEHSSQGEFSASFSDQNLLRLKTQILSFLNQTKNLARPKLFNCLDPIEISIGNDAPQLRCREAMSRRQKESFFKLVLKLSELARP
jgi:hypothetical protein